MGDKSSSASDNDNSNVVVLDVETSLDLPLERILDGARDAELSDAVVLGWDKNNLLHFASQTTDVKKMLLLLELAKASLIRRLMTQ